MQSYEDNPRSLKTTKSLKLASGSLLLFTSLLLLAPCSWASWSKPLSMGTATGIGNPSCATVSSEHLVCAVLSPKAAMIVKEYNGTSWGSPQTLAGTIASAPSCTSDGDGKVFCAATAANGDMEVATFNGTSWETPVAVPGTLYSAPSCASYKPGEVVCMARNSTGGVQWTLFDNTWTAFASLGTTAISAPNCTSDHEDGVICSFYTIGGQVLVNRYAAGAWEGFINLAGTGAGLIDCTYWQPSGQVACFANATLGGIFVSTYNGKGWAAGNWSGFENLDGETNDVPSCTGQASGELVCAAVSVTAPDKNLFFANVYNGNNWSGWTQETAAGIGSPSCTPFSSGKVMCVLRGLNNTYSSVVGP
jgi:hypothetical protein